MLGYHSKIYAIRDETYVFRRDLTNDEIRKALDTLSAERDKEDVAYVCEKSPSHIRKCDEIFRLFPAAKFVAIVREPRDVVASFKRRGVPVHRGIRNWQFAYRSLSRWKAAGLPLHQIHFEKLITAPAETLTGVCNYLGLSYEPELLDYWKDPRPWQGVTEVRKPPTVQGKDHVVYRNWQIHQPLMTDRIGTYHADLTAEDLEMIQRKVARVAPEFGYDLGQTAGISLL